MPGWGSDGNNRPSSDVAVHVQTLAMQLAWYGAVSEESMRFEVVPTVPNPGNRWFGALWAGLGGPAESSKFAMLGVHEGDPVSDRSGGLRPRFRGPRGGMDRFSGFGRGFRKFRA